MVSDDGLSPVDAARMLADLVDILIPGGDGWPSAATVGVQAALASRLVETQGEDAMGQLIAAVRAAGGPFDTLPAAQRVTVVQTLERQEPALFGRLRDVVFVTYYESPSVAAAINAKGHIYKLRPHLSGYQVKPFDLKVDTPTHGRGAYVPTDDVRPVKVTGLALDTQLTDAWGRGR